MKRFIASVLALTCLICLAPAQETEPSPPEPPAQEEDALHREQSIYIPYEKLWRTFEQEGRGVFLPYERFLELWEKATRDADRAPKPQEPVDALLTEVTATATVAEDVVRVRAEIQLEVLREGWNEVPLRLADAAITQATLDGEPARLVHTPGKGYRLLVHKPEEETRSYTLEMEYAKSYEKSPGRNRVSFQAPLSALNRWEVRIPESGVEVNVRPFLATTDASVEGGATNETRVLAFVGAAPKVEIDWTPKAEGAKGLQALASAQAEHEIYVEEGVVRAINRLTYEISRTELSHFELEVPADFKVVNVFDPNVREWSVAAEDDRQLIRVELFQPTKGTQKLLVETERYGGDAGEVTVPYVKALDAGRQQGAVVVRIGAGLRGEVVAREGLLQLDRSELPGALSGGAWNFAFRYAGLPYRLGLRIEQVQPRILVESLTENLLTPDALRVHYTAVFDVQRAGVFRLGLRVPEGFEVERVEGRAVAGAAAAQVDTFHVEEGGKLVVNLGTKALGKVGLYLTQRRRLEEPDLLNPTGHWVALATGLPRAEPEEVERENSRLVVFAPESLRLNPAEREGMRTISHREAVETLPSGGAEGLRPVLAFAYSGPSAALDLSVQRRAPHVTTRQLLHARVESGVVIYNARFFYDVKYSGVKSFRIDLPEKLANQVRVVSSGIRHAALEVSEGREPLPEGYMAWQLQGESEFLGSADIRMTWEEKIAKLDIGKSVELEVPRLIPADLNRAWGQIVLSKAEAIDLAPEEAFAGLRPIDPQHDLMPGAGVSDAAMAFEFQAPWQLKLKATRYETQEVKATSIERGLVQMVLTRSKTVSVQALYQMRSARQRLTIEIPGEADAIGFDTQPVRLNGRPVSLEKGEAGRYFVPLVGIEQDEPFLLELRYVNRQGSRKLQTPAFPDDPAVQQVFLSAYLPKNLVYIGRGGPWTDEIVWRLRGFSTSPKANRTRGELLEWVTRGLSLDRAGLESFATDGNHVLFSTLRPVAGPEGALSLRAVHRWLLQFVVIGLIVLVGVTQLQASLGRRALVVGGLLVLVILAAVFTPSLARAMVNNAAMAAGGIVLILWLIWYLLVMRPDDPAVKARRQARLARARAPKPSKQRHHRPTPPPPTPPAGDDAPASSEEKEPGHE